VRPVPTEGTNLTLTVPGAGRKGDLPAERCRFINPDPPHDEQPGYETAWQPNPGEARALANGAAVLLRVWGNQHPPVNIVVGEPNPDTAEAQLPASLVHIALGILYGHLEVHQSELALNPQEFLDLWARSLAQARKQAAQATQHAGQNGTSAQT